MASSFPPPPVNTIGTLICPSTSKHTIDIYPYRLGQYWVQSPVLFAPTPPLRIWLLIGSQRSQWSHRVQLQCQDRKMDCAQIRRGPLPTYPRHGTRSQLRSTMLRRSKSLPRPVRQPNQHLPAQAKRRANATLCILDQHPRCPHRPLQQVRTPRRIPERRVRTPTPHRRSNVHPTSPLR